MLVLNNQSIFTGEYCQISARPWNILLRKIRLCLLIRLRLDRVPLGAFPLTVANVEDGTLFSINSWIAQDELSISHKQSEINSLETTCWGSQGAFNPSSPEGDVKTNQMVVERSCKKIKDKNSHEWHSNPLLLFLRHYDNPIQLAAHRALLLSTMWGQDVSESLINCWLSLLSSSFYVYLL